MATFGKRWSKQELDVLKTSEDIDELVKKLPSRTKGAIRSKIAQLSQNPEPIMQSLPWTAEQLNRFPTEMRVDKTILHALAEELGMDKNQLWRKMKSLGYTWVKSETLEPTEDNPYPMHGLKWTEEELALFPEDKEVTKEILEGVVAKIPLRKPTSIWPKMKKEGYTWVAPEESSDTQQTEVRIAPTLTEDEKYVLSLAHELGFREKNNQKSPTIKPGLEDKYGYNEQVAIDFNLPIDFVSGELYYAIGQRISPFPWEMNHCEEIATAYRDRDKKSIMEAAKALHQRLEEFING